MVLSSAALVYTYPDSNRKPMFLFMSISSLVGFFIEVLGINTGAIFGTYAYGEVLGWKIWGTPLVIGLNWFLVTYCVNQVVSTFKINHFVHAVLAGFFITAFDYIIEPDAIRLLMWTWEGNTVPLQNYIAWFIVSFALSYYYTTLRLPKHSMAYLVLALMVLFFIAG